jgi:hypothetical protein
MKRVTLSDARTSFVRRSQSCARVMMNASCRAKSLVFLSEWCNRKPVHVDSRLHFCDVATLIPGGQHGEEEKESSGEEDQEASEEEVSVRRFEVSDSLETLEIAS